MDARRLRDATGNTHLLILAILERRRPTTLSRVAQDLAITVQAVSSHARLLAARGWLAQEEGMYRVTPDGLQALHEGMRALRDAVDAVARPLSVIHTTSALAAAPVRAGQRVGLRMRGGDLAAHPEWQAASEGMARGDAQQGDEVIVADLRGVVELAPGRITVVRVPSPAEGGISGVDEEALAETDAPGLVGARGTGARILARRLHGRLDLAFAADQAAFNAAERGLDVLLYVTRDRSPETLQALERLNEQTIHRVPIRLVEAPGR